ncbi:hypothetical protein R5R35_005779 [Gryllus longicercus]|uniref:Endonuclease/exonuclease/phosphatase domain-containing protein n=1 Tax=Gryllus longicercus TaxID=2509291 RepID=A0AAN9ZIT4_9ORTH
MKIGTWNIQGLRAKQREVISEIEKMNLDIIILTETKKKGGGEEILNEYLHIWSGVPKDFRAKSGVSFLIKRKWTKFIKRIENINERILRIDMNVFRHKITILGVYAVNDNALVDEKNKFFQDLRETIASIPYQNEIILIGDFNSRVGNREREVVGQYGEESINDNGKRLINLCKEHALCVGNTLFRPKNIHKYTRIEPVRNIQSVIDLVVVKNERRVNLNDMRVYRQPECGTDHHMVVSKHVFPFRNKRRCTEKDTDFLIEENNVNFKTDLLKQYSVEMLYQNRIKNKLENSEDKSPEEMYNHLKEAVFEAAKEVLGVEQEKSKFVEKFSENLESMIKEKKKLYLAWISNRNDDTRKEYVEKRKEVKELVKIEKNEHWERLCRDIDSTLGYNRSTKHGKQLKI